jgi:predicted permease
MSERRDFFSQNRLEVGKNNQRAGWMPTWLQQLKQDVVFGIRVLRKSPAFTAVAIATLALAIGANAVVFGILNALIIRPLNVPEPQSLYLIERTNAVFGNYESYPNYIDLRDRNRSFDGLAAYNISQAALDTGDHPTTGWVYEVSCNYFDVLRLRPHLGSFFHASDDHGPNSAPYVVLNYTYWHLKMKDDPGVVGRVVQLNKHPFTILGVASPEFHGTFPAFAPDFYAPIINQEQFGDKNDLNDRGRRWVFMTMGHLRPGVTPEQAADDLNAISAYLEKTYPKQVSNLKYGLGRPALGGSTLGRGVTSFVVALMALAGLILLAACANLGSLFAARAADRGREVALRLALGATRLRILRQLLTEAMLISVVGGSLGIVASVYLLRALSVWQPFSRFPMTIPVTPDANVYIVAVLLALVSGLLFGLVPVRQVMQTDPYDIVKSGTRTTGGRRVTFRDVLVVVQIAICAVLVTASIVAVRGLVRSMSAHLGIVPQGVMLVQTNLGMAGYTEQTAPLMQKRMLEEAAVVHGVESVGYVSYPPLAMGAGRSTVYRDETTDLRPANSAAQPYTFSVSPDYFKAAGTMLLSGRTVTWQDDKKAPLVAIVSRDFARKLFGSEANVEGKYFKQRDGSRVQVIGVVEEGKYLTVSEAQTPAVFYPMLQSVATETWLVVRSKGNPSQLATPLATKLHALDPAMPFYMQTWERDLAGAMFATRVATVALGVLGLIGAMLSITGIFGMAAYSISKRMRELGIRMALGAQRKQVLQTALGRAVKLLALGSTAGLVLGVLASRVLAAIVYQATPRDPLVLTGVVLAMSAVGLVATWIPAQRALHIDPLVLLREE